MRSTPRFLIISILAAVVLSLWAAEGATACSCIRLNLESYRQADEAIVAKLAAIEEIDAGESAFPSSEYTFRVGRSYKKPNRVERGDTIRVRAGSDSASCGFGSQVGSELALLLYREDGRWSSSLCSSTTPGRLKRLAGVASGAERKVSRPDDASGCSAAQ